MTTAFGVYVHIPYCRVKCPYCDFNVYAARRWPEARYVATVCGEASHYAQQAPWQAAEVSSIFFGGGTPSLFAPASIGAVVDHVARHWHVRSGAEIALEANPDGLCDADLRGLRAAGVNRLSLGAQSFNPRHLQRLGRTHRGDDVVTAVEAARQAGITDIGLDLIFAVPDQSLAEWEDDLSRALALAPTHLSAYGLTYEERTPFHRWRALGRLRPVPEEIEVAMFTRAHDRLSAAGYRHYEVSNYALPGYESQHNLTYWRSRAYLGLGAGAHSYSGPPRAPETGAEPAAGWGARWSNARKPMAFMDAVERDGHARIDVEQLTQRQARGEFVFLGLRCLDGIAASAFRARFGEDFLCAFPHAAELCEQGLLELADERWRLTDRGILLADSVFASFL